MHILFLEPFLTPILFICITVVLAIGFFVLWSIYRKEETFEKKREEEFGEYENVLTQAHQKAETILQDEAQDASKMSQEGTSFIKKIDDQTEHAIQAVVEKHMASLSQTSQAFLTNYQTSLQAVKNKSEEEITNMLQKMQQDTLQEMTQLHETFRKKTIDAQEGLSKQLEDAFAKTQMEIHEYKKRKIQDITSRMDTFIIRISEEVLGQTIPLAQQQQLITQALEKAQKEGLFEL